MCSSFDFVAKRSALRDDFVQTLHAKVGIVSPKQGRWKTQAQTRLCWGAACEQRVPMAEPLLRAGWEGVNSEWMEALDVGSGRLYFIRMEMNGAHDVRPTGLTEWEAPPGFLVRGELVAALSKAQSEVNDDAAFLARVRQRFPPPPPPPPAAASPTEVASLRQQVAKLEAEKQEMELAVSQANAAADAANAARLAAEARAAAGAGGASASSTPAPPLGSALQRPSWKRGASQRFANGAAQPPPPPEWARAMSRNASGYGPYDAYDADSQPPIPGRLGRKMSGAI